MDDIEKLFRKLSPKEHAELEGIVSALLAGGRKGPNISKVAGTDFWRLRKRRFRIIFHYAHDGMPIIDSIRLRNEGTYRDLT